MSHQHPLICLQNSTRRHSWICDFCSRASEDLIRETYSYRCKECDFDLCFDCVQPRQHPAHYHALEVAESAYNILHSWFCDICGCPNKPDEMYVPGNDTICTDHCVLSCIILSAHTKNRTGEGTGVPKVNFRKISVRKTI